MRFNHNPSFALDYLAMDGERLTEAEQAATAKAALPATLEALAEGDNQLSACSGHSRGCEGGWPGHSSTRGGVGAVLAKTSTDGPDLARKLRKALDDLLEVGEDAGELVCIIEDSFDIDYPATDGEWPSEAEQAAARMALPGALDTIAKAENQVRKQLWLVSKARRSLARTLRAEQGEAHGRGGHHAGAR
ncbi:MAG: hypothetical protein WBP56_08255 [Polyangia bacterium]